MPHLAVKRLLLVLAAGLLLGVALVSNSFLSPEPQADVSLRSMPEPVETPGPLLLEMDTPPDGMFSKRLYTPEDLDPAAVNSYVLNRSSGVFHRPGCSAVDRMNAENRETVTGSRPEMIAAGHTACRICCP